MDDLYKRVYKLSKTHRDDLVIAKACSLWKAIHSLHKIDSISSDGQTSGLVFFDGHFSLSTVGNFPWLLKSSRSHFFMVTLLTAGPSEHRVFQGELAPHHRSKVCGSKVNPRLACSNSGVGPMNNAPLPHHAPPTINSNPAMSVIHWSQVFTLLGVEPPEDGALTFSVTDLLQWGALSKLEVRRTRTTPDWHHQCLCGPRS